jgi:thioredoxin reductase (NADPH)
VVVLADGTSLVRPTPLEVAERIGLQTRASAPFYDLVIVGAGPSGLAAAVYGASEGLRTLVVESDAPGGQAGTSAAIENYLGFPVGLSGGDLARRAVAQARRFGAEILTPRVATGIRADDPYRFVQLSDGSEVACHAVLIATGVAYRTLDVPGADRLGGAGLYYGSVLTEVADVRGADVFVVGAGNSAGQAATYLAKHAAAVTMLVRGASLSASMSRYLIDQIAANGRITVRPRVVVEELHGGDDPRGAHAPRARRRHLCPLAVRGRVRVHRRQAANGVGPRRHPPRSAGLPLERTRSRSTRHTPRRLDAGARAALAGDEHPRRLRGGRRATSVGEARRQRGR